MGSLRSFWRSGHWPSLLGSFLYFDLSFMLWVLLSALSVFIVEDFHLSASQKGVLVALPALGGAVFRIVLGKLADRIGTKKTALIGLAITLLPLTCLWLFKQSLFELYLCGFLLGIAGGSFAVAIPLVSRWYPPRYQGLALGITGSGNSGSLLATLFAPGLALYFHDWQTVFGIAMIPIIFVFILCLLIVQEPPRQPKKGRYFLQGSRKRIVIFSYFYSITFGGFVGLISFLSLFLADQYSFDKTTIGYWVSFLTLAGSLARTAGGWISDKIGGTKVLNLLFLIMTFLFLSLSSLQPSPWQIFSLWLLMLCFGLGNGAVFQLVPSYFGSEVGSASGWIGAAGGLGGFFLPILLGWTKDHTGTYATGFLLLALITAGGWIAVWLLGRASAKAGISSSQSLSKKDGMITNE
jgi:NNP family nitrate/nitrite transporter-like MFS transporter